MVPASQMSEIAVSPYAENTEKAVGKFKLGLSKICAFFNISHIFWMKRLIV